MSKTPQPKTPECDKVSALKGENQSTGAFCDWLTSNAVFKVCERHVHTEPCDRKPCLNPEHTGEGDCDGCGPADKFDETDRDFRACGMLQDEFFPTRKSVQEIISLYFDIDLKKMAAEQDALLKWVQEQNEEN